MTSRKPTANDVISELELYLVSAYNKTETNRKTKEQQKTKQVLKKKKKKKKIFFNVAPVLKFL